MRKDKIAPTSHESYVIFSALFAPSTGGVENYTSSLAQELIRRGKSVVVVTSQLGDDPETEVTPEGFEVVRLPSWKLLNGRLPVSRKNAKYRRLMEALLDRRIDHVVVNTRFYRHSLEGLRFAAAKGIRPLLIEHGSDHLTLGNAAFDAAIAAYEHGVTERVKAFSPAVYGVSGKSVEWLCHFGIKGEGVIENAIDAPAFRSLASSRDFRSESNIKDGALLVTFIGRLVPEKGIGALLGAADMLSKNESIHFAVAGTGVLADAVKNYRNDNLSFYGKLDRPDVSALLSQSDIFCLPSRSEGFATALLECASWGVPPITTDIGGARELVPDEGCGVILPDMTGKSLADAISSLAENRLVPKQMGERVRALVEKEHTWAKTADSLQKALDFCPL